MDAVGKFYKGKNPNTAARELAEHKVSASPEAFMYQQRKMRAQMGGKLRNPMIHYARIRSVRYNMDVRIAQLEKMRAQMEKRPGESQQEHKERIQAMSLGEDGEDEKPKLPTTAIKQEKRVYQKDDEVGFYFNKLAGAVESENQDEINRAVLVAFFEENAPERLEEVDQLLEDNKGKEEELFKQLAEEHPLPGTKELVKDGDDVEEIQKAKDAIDKDFDERNDGKFVLHMAQKNGGKWWVNRTEPAQHSSQRKRETLLPQLRRRGGSTVAKTVEVPLPKPQV